MAFAKKLRNKVGVMTAQRMETIETQIGYKIIINPNVRQGNRDYDFDAGAGWRDMDDFKAKRLNKKRDGDPDISRLLCCR